MQNMAERLAENSHDIWAKKKKEELMICGEFLFIFIVFSKEFQITLHFSYNRRWYS